MQGVSAGPAAPHSTQDSRADGRRLSTACRVRLTQLSAEFRLTVPYLSKSYPSFSSHHKLPLYSESSILLEAASVSVSS